MSLRHALVLAAVLAGGLPGLAAGQSQSDRFPGNWTLDRALSRYADHSPPDRMTVVIELVPDGLQYRSQTRFAGGRSTATSFVAPLDGTPALVVGSTGLLAPVSLRRAGNDRIDATYTLGLKKVAWSRWSVNAAGNELLVVTTWVNARGDRVHNTAVYRRTAAER